MGKKKKKTTKRQDKAIEASDWFADKDPDDLPNDANFDRDFKKYIMKYLGLGVPPPEDPE